MEVSNGFLISWQEPLEKIGTLTHYSIEYKMDKEWRSLNRDPIRSVDSSYLHRNLVGSRTYYFHVFAHYLGDKKVQSEDFRFPVPARVKHKAIMAAVVGGILFFIVAIILSICAVKICNQRKRRKQEKGEIMFQSY